VITWFSPLTISKPLFLFPSSTTLHRACEKFIVQVTWFGYSHYVYWHTLQAYLRRKWRVDKLQVEVRPQCYLSSPFKPRRLLFRASVSGRKTPSYNISFQFCLSCRLSSLNPELRIVQGRNQLSVIGHKPELHHHRLDEVLHALHYKVFSTHQNFDVYPLFVPVLLYRNLESSKT